MCVCVFVCCVCLPLFGVVLLNGFVFCHHDRLGVVHVRAGCFGCRAANVVLLLVLVNEVRLAKLGLFLSAAEAAASAAVAVTSASSSAWTALVFNQIGIAVTRVERLLLFDFVAVNRRDDCAGHGRDNATK